ncbi:MAG TPA: SCO family protein [Blastocatellia bacterium]|nr:SCO family protein [Blastocatellia bacterium]
MDNRRGHRESRGHQPNSVSPCRERRVQAFMLFVLFSFLLPGSLFAQSWGQGPPPRRAPIPAGEKPRDLEEVRIDQRLNELLPLDVVFRDENGNKVKLGDYFGDKPVVLAFVYYTCPMLCNQVLNGMTSGLDVLKTFSIGKEFEVVTVSFDPRETPELAREKKETYIKWYDRESAAEGWHFLTGDQLNIDRLTDAAGFHYKWDEKTAQFIHASGIMIATPDGRLARYFYGIEYAPKDLRLGLVEASDGKVGSPVDQLLLYCYHYDPTSGKYGLMVMNLMMAGGILTVIAMIAMFIVFRRRDLLARRTNAGGVV